MLTPSFRSSTFEWRTRFSTSSRSSNRASRADTAADVVGRGGATTAGEAVIEAVVVVGKAEDAVEVGVHECRFTGWRSQE
jgi:hypothetical protein